MKRGDVVLVNFPEPDPKQPVSVQKGRRPAVVVQTDEGTDWLKTVVVVPLTSRMKARNFPAAIKVVPTVLNNLDQPSIALCHQLQVVDKRRHIAHPIGELDEADMETIEEAIRGFLELD